MDPFAACVGITVVSTAYALLDGREEPVSQRTKELTTSLRTYVVGAVAWPAVWYVLVGPDLLSRFPLAYAGLLWPVVTLLFDALHVTQKPLQDEEGAPHRFSQEGHSISTLAFALGGLLATQVGRDFAQKSSPMLSACIFMVVAFIVSGPSVNAHSSTGAVLGAIRKLAVSYSIGLLISSIAIGLKSNR